MARVAICFFIFVLFQQVISRYCIAMYGIVPFTLDNVPDLSGDLVYGLSCCLAST